jgi:hypothetical protein
VRSAMSVVRSVLEAAKGGSFHRPMTESQARRTPVSQWSGRCRDQATRTHGGRTAQGPSIHKIADGDKAPDGPLHPRRPLYAWRGGSRRRFLPVWLDRPGGVITPGTCGRNSPVREKVWTEIRPQSSRRGPVRSVGPRQSPVPGPTRPAPRAPRHPRIPRRTPPPGPTRTCGRAAPRDAGRPFRGGGSATAVR